MTTQTASRVRRRRPSLRDVLDSNLAALVISGAVAVLVSPLLNGPAFVDEVSVVNPSEYDIGVQVAGGERDGWMNLGTAAKRSTKATAEVIDQEGIWVFRFAAQGRQGGEFRVTRGDLQKAGWSIEVPAEVIGHLRQLGAGPSP